MPGEVSGLRLWGFKVFGFRDLGFRRGSGACNALWSGWFCLY
jgi:hypothetical protein